LIRILIIKFIIPRWRPLELVMCILYKRELYSKYTTEAFQKKYNTSAKNTANSTQLLN